MTSELLTGDCLLLLPTLADGCADLVATDPPFGIGFSGYDVYDDRTTRADYLRFADAWTAQAVRVLAPTGSLVVAIGDEFAAEYKVRLDALGLTMRNWLIWTYGFGTHQNHKFGRSKTHLLYYVRDPKRFTFNADAVRVESQRQRNGDKRANPKGRVPSDVWTFSRLAGNFKERTGHPCQTPVALMDRIVLALSNPGGLVLDPFSGSGSTLASAKRLGRRWWGCELSSAYADGVRSRLAAIPDTDAA